MTFLTGPIPGLSPKPKRSFVSFLLTVIWLQLCLAIGIFVSPLAAEMGWRQSLLPPPDQVTQVSNWRRSRYLPAADPRPGQPAPALALKTERGRPLDPRALLGRNTVLLFVD